MDDNKKKQFGTMDYILIIVAVSMLIFTIVMIVIFLKYGAIPDTLCTCVFASLGGECGVMGWIKTTKERMKDREWLVEDRKGGKTENHQDKPNEESEEEAYG